MFNLLSCFRPPQASFNLSDTIAQSSQNDASASTTGTKPRISNRELQKILDDWCKNSPKESRRDCKIAAQKILETFNAATQSPENIAATRLDFGYVCNRLHELPDVIGELTTLKFLSLYHCSQLKLLPESLSYLSNLQQLDLNGCEILKTLPESLGNLKNLQELQIKQCFSLHSLPESLGNLKKLQKIQIEQCSSLESLPESLENLSSLTDLDLSECTNLKTLPKNLSNLKTLKQILLYQLDKLESLPENLNTLNNLESLNIAHCLELQTLPAGFNNFPKLNLLAIWNCNSLETLPVNFKNLPNLKTLAITDCNKLQALPASLGILPKLERLGLNNCPNVRTLPNDLGSHKNLERIEANSCAFSDVPASIVDCKKLNHLNFDNNNFSHVPDALLRLPANAEVLLRGNPLPDEEIIRVQNLLRERRAQGLPTPNIILPQLQNPELNMDNALRMAAEGGMNVHTPELSAAVNTRIQALAKQFPEHLSGTPDAQKKEMREIQLHCIEMLKQFGANDKALSDAVEVANNMFAIGLGNQSSYVNDFQFSTGHALAYVMLAMDRQWSKTPAEHQNEAKHNGIRELINALANSKGFCDTRKIEEVFQLADMAMSKYAQEHPDVIETKPIPLTTDQMRALILDDAKQLLAEMLQGPSSSNRTENAIQIAFKEAFINKIQSEHPRVQKEQVIDFVETQIFAAWDTFLELVQETSKAS